MLDRRSILRWGAALVARSCSEMNSRSPLLAPSPTSYVYERGNYRITLGTPYAIVTAGGANGPFAWFAGLHRDPVTKNIMCRWSNNTDTGADGLTNAVISSDDGKTFPTATLTTVAGKPSPQEPCVQEADGTFHGPEFWRLEKVGGNPRILRCGYNTWTNGFATYVYTAGGCTITGFPADIGSYGDAPGISWTDRVVRISDAQWISTVQVVVPSIQGQTMSYVVESTDRGHNWVVVGQLTANGAAAVGSEGFSEVSTFRCANGDLVSIGRCGPLSVARVRSADLGRTWSAPDITLGAWWKSPCANLLSTGDFVLTTGYINRDPYVVQNLAPAAMGLYVSDDPMAANVPPVDLTEHHNTMLGEVAFDPQNPSTGYTSFQETDVPGNILINYDQCGHSRGTLTTRPDRIYIVAATIKRMS